MLSRDLAAYEVPSADPELREPTVAPTPGLEVATARAEGVLIGLNDGSVLASEFARLLEAVRAAGNAETSTQYRAS
ncbi:hypothetical protein SAMN05445060_4104 [Williamsia sterculiae]|uniref:Uncharacterized protein n=1 Tax=Williamsia sterculiae TaxID=1344003 RepID=A0A1N7HER0_9NOCA|nr:hypothetical protein SAMN05445060_4104 [Williamsia sterculiae]